MIAGRPGTPAGQPRSSGRGSRPLIGPFTGRHLLTLGIVLAAVAALLSILRTPLGTPIATSLPQPDATFVVTGEETEGLRVGDRAPELEGTVDGHTVGLVDLDGRPVRLADLRGRPVWVNFWASWCPPCQFETPVLKSVYERYRDQGLALVAVSTQETTPDDVRRYAATYALDYTIGFDASAAVFTAWQNYGLPTQYFIDRDGVIRAVWKGPLSESQVDQLLAPLVRTARSGPEPSLPRAP